MEQQCDLIDEAIKAGKLTVCPPALAAGHVKRVTGKRGERIRPCRGCAMPVKFVNGAWKSHNQRREGWHWVNENGTHHWCTDFRQAGPEMASPHAVMKG